MMHPMEYSNVVQGEYPDNASLNQTQYNALLQLITMVKAEFTVTTLRNIPTVATARASSTTGQAPPATTSSTTTSTTSSHATTSTTGAAKTTTTSTGKSTTTSAVTSTTGGAVSTTGTASSTSTTGTPVNLKNCSCVVFRLDDIQDYWLNTVQTTIMDTFRNRSLPLTIGVIANYFGTDSVVVNNINKGLNDTKWSLEVADHGWNHEDFTTLAYAQQLSLLQQASLKIKSVLPNATLKSFIPPYNTFNNNTITALKTAGYSYMSSEMGEDHPPYPLSGNMSYYRGNNNW
jgi:hypothetical protein